MARLFIETLTRMGHDVTVLSQLRSYNPEGDPGREQQVAADAKQEIEHLTQSWQKDASARPDLLFTYHVYHKAADYLGPQLKARFGLPYIIAEPSVAPKRAAGRWAAGYRQAGTAIKMADALLAITTLDRACLASFAGAGKVIPFPPFLDPAPFALAAAARDESRSRLAGQYRLAEDQPWLLAVGMMRPGDKLASFKRLAETLQLASDQPWQMLIAGDGPERQSIEAAFAPMGNRVCFLGQMAGERLAGLYAACDLYVWPAVNEAYGMALLEAQSAGLPVLSVSTRGVPDIVIHGETGWLTGNDQPSTLHGGLQDMLADRTRLAGMSNAAKIRVARHLSITAAQERLASVFVRLGLTA